MAKSPSYEIQEHATRKLNNWVNTFENTLTTNWQLAMADGGTHYYGNAACRSEITGTYAAYKNQLVQVANIGDRALRLFAFQEVPEGEFFPAIDDYPYGEPAGDLPPHSTFRASRLHGWMKVYRTWTGSGQRLVFCAHNPAPEGESSVTGLFIDKAQLNEVSFEVVEIPFALQAHKPFAMADVSD